MKIYNPKIERVSLDKVRLNCQFESNGVKDTLWYEFDAKWEEYLVIEQSDAFVVGLLLLALKNDEDIYIEGTISNKLLYQLNNYLIPMLSHVFSDFNCITVKSKEVTEINFAEFPKFKSLRGAATGVSCGVDSFSTIKKHYDQKGEIKLKYLTFFNAGSHGDYGGENSRNLFKKRLKRVSVFTNELHVDLISVDSNISELLKMKFIHTDSLRNLSCVLSIQKLFTNYYYSSAMRFERINFNANGMHNYDILINNYLNTESISFYSSMTDMSREERTNYISNYKYAQKYLDVCTSSNHTGFKRNCSTCAKCMRTMLTLDLLKKLNEFDKVFDLKKYEKNLDYFIASLLSKRDLYELDKTLLLFLKSNNFKFTLKHKILSEKIKMIRFARGVKKIFKY